MPLDGDQFGQFETALLSAFPERFALKQMIRRKFNLNLDTIVGGGNYAEVVFNLVGWAEAQGRVQELIEKAREENPGNDKLKSFEQQILQPGRIGLQQPTPPPISIPTSTYPSQPSAGLDTNLDPYVWFRQLHEKAKTVCRIESFQALGTAFLVAPNLVLTCYHLLIDFDSDPPNPGYPKPPSRMTGSDVAGVTLRFGFLIEAEKGILPQQGLAYKLADDWLVDSSAVDDLNYALLRIDGNPGYDLIKGPFGEEQRGWLTFKSDSHSDPGTSIHVLHHPSGEPLKFVTGVRRSPSEYDKELDDLYLRDRTTRVLYEAFTQPGSSGAPCFTSSWHLFALHERTLASLNSMSLGIDIGRIFEQPKVRAALSQAT